MAGGQESGQVCRHWHRLVVVETARRHRQTANDPRPGLFLGRAISYLVDKTVLPLKRPRLALPPPPLDPGRHDVVADHLQLHPWPRLSSRPGFSWSTALTAWTPRLKLCPLAARHLPCLAWHPSTTTTTISLLLLAESLVLMLYNTIIT